MPKNNKEKQLVEYLLHHILNNADNHVKFQKNLKKSQSNNKFFDNMGIGDMTKPMSKRLSKAASPNDFMQSSNQNFPSFTYQNNPNRQQNYGKYNSNSNASTSSNANSNYGQQTEPKTQKSPYAGTSNTSNNVSSTPYSNQGNQTTNNVVNQNLQPSSNNTNTSANYQNNISQIPSTNQNTQTQSSTYFPQNQSGVMQKPTTNTVVQNNNQTFSDYMSQNSRTTQQTQNQPSAAFTYRKKPVVKPILTQTQFSAESNAERLKRITANNPITTVGARSKITGEEVDVNTVVNPTRTDITSINAKAYDYLVPGPYKYTAPKTPDVVLLNDKGEIIVPTDKVPYTPAQKRMIADALKNKKPGEEAIVVNSSGQKLETQGSANMARLPQIVRDKIKQITTKHQQTALNEYNTKKNTAIALKNAKIKALQDRLTEALARGTIPDDLKQYLRF